MEECELCGRQTKDIYVLSVENVELRACASCAKGKKVIRTELDRARTSTSAKNVRPKRISDEDLELMDDYATKIRQAREKMKLPIKVLAEMINEKEHLILRIEENKTKPDIALTKKLEKFLKIKLTEEPAEESGNYQAKRIQGATLGDFVDN